MLSFFKKLLLMFALVFLTVVLIFGGIFFLPINKDEFEGAYIDKLNRLSSLRSPKIILVGGSNLAFGIDSKKIEQSTGYDVINLGLHGGVGLRFMIEDVKPFIKKGDIVILSPEYENFDTGLEGSNFLNTIISIYPKAIFSLTTPRQFEIVFSNLFVFIKREIRDTSIAIIKGNHRGRCRSPNYCRFYFNENGDEIHHLVTPPPFQVVDSSILPFSYPSHESINLITDFALYVKSKDAKVLYSFPPLIDTVFNPNKDVLNKIFENLNNIQELTILDTPATYSYPPAMFFDTLYHLNVTGRDKRTSQLVFELTKDNTLILKAKTK